MLSPSATNRWLLGLCISQHFNVEMQHFNVNKSSTDGLSMELWNSSVLRYALFGCIWKDSQSQEIFVDRLPSDQYSLASWKFVCSSSLALGKEDTVIISLRDTYFSADFNLSTASIVYNRTGEVIKSSERVMEVNETYFFYGLGIAAAFIVVMGVGYCTTVIMQKKEIQKLRLCTLFQYFLYLLVIEKVLLF